MKKKLTYKNILGTACLLTGLVMSSAVSANLVNVDFSNGLNGWGGDVVYYDTENDMDNNVTDVIFGDYSNNFSTTSNSVTLNTFADTTNEYWGVYLYQEFMVAAGTSEISLKIDSTADYAYVTLVDENLDLVHDFKNGGLSVDISTFIGSLMSLEFGIEDSNYAYDDYLTVSNITISKQSISVTEPASWALFLLALAGIIKRFIKIA
ncbi:hypothetical protein Q4530_08345 [Colwellia sp. 1_MG-2023]|uniref:hypothetical protein n=1 Tax=unclassified Colwellia TaxID=196834 RepID=UPI001C0963AD|nr:MULTISPECIES: hypothetical protein [unclassified Colwellia]MBU2924269.1 hypothetical protein [Colwellia sp. C2M11]MDO6652978.1 hypothetical protein [Colwellia sp. 3_MG-2023]MDO6665460.1 hypothetical protein [Colwellia sp. 2_MG-2023]MDO6689781.1 hypothetical protein [Colwellia sp. 1_MG-2023]